MVSYYLLFDDVDMKPIYIMGQPLPEIGRIFNITNLTNGDFFINWVVYQITTNIGIYADNSMNDYIKPARIEYSVYCRRAS